MAESDKAVLLKNEENEIVREPVVARVTPLRAAAPPAPSGIREAGVEVLAAGPPLVGEDDANVQIAVDSGQATLHSTT